MSSRTLLGKSALVTGATSGIGEVTAYALATAGAHVLVVGRRSDLGNNVVRTIEQSGGKAKFFAADMRSSEEINAMVNCAVNEFGKLDIAFNNAGIFDRMNDFHIYSDDSWDEMLAVNLTGVFRCMRAELASMITSGGGVIINNASTVSHRGSLRASPAYVAAKHGVLGLTKQAAIQYVNQGVRVNAVSPGPTETAMSAPLVAQGAEAVAQALAQLNPTASAKVANRTVTHSQITIWIWKPEPVTPVAMSRTV